MILEALHRIARAIADLALARSEGSSQRFYRMSAQIREERGNRSVERDTAQERWVAEYRMR